MDLSGKMVKQVEILSDGDVFYEIFAYKLYCISEMSHGNIQGVDLLEGDWGTVGSVIFFKYTIGMCQCLLFFIMSFWALFRLRIFGY